MSESKFDTFRRNISPGFSRVTRAERVRFALLYASLGAVAGMAVGMAIAERTGGVDGLLQKLGLGGRGGNSDRHRENRYSSGWEAEDAASDVFADDDNDSELAPESIAHMHVRGSGTISGQSSRMAERVKDLRDRVLPARGSDTGMASGGASRRGGFDREVPASTTAERAVRMTPLRSLPDEAALEARVLEAFINDPILRARAIDICASGVGTIELTGWVQESNEIGHALTLAGGVPDVKTVIDRLAVRGGAPARDHSGSRYAGPPPAAASRDAKMSGRPRDAVSKSMPSSPSKASMEETPPLPNDPGSTRAD